MDDDDLGGTKLGGGVMAIHAASSMQRKGEGGESRGADGEYAPYLLMEELLEKLKMMNYERKMPGSFNPLSHSYFAIASPNPAEQFYYFTSLCSWLMSLQRISWNAPSQMDDPSSAVSALYVQLQQMGAPCDFPPQKLRHGYGEHCCRVLKHLVDAIPIEFKPAVYNDDLEYEEAAVDEDAEVVGEDVADEVGAADVDEEEFYHGGGGGDGAGEQKKLTDSILDATVEPEEWRIELERVTPQLKLQVVSDPKEWRNRLVSTKTHQQTVAQLAPEIFQTLERLSDDMERTLQAVRKAEQKLNSLCQGEVAELQQKQDELQLKREEFNKHTEQINSLSNELASITEELDKIKEKLDERGNSMTDASPLLKVKSALSRLKTEAKQMDIRIGVVTHTLVAKKLKHDQHTKAEAAVPKNSHMKNESYLDDDLDD
mmetsp:Transcript_11757/g.29055  ORF Transcript_11757/g.29055 Transcript_11757/m.29055 type:complete len:429 (+) Transcript_11757:74-1360(+)